MKTAMQSLGVWSTFLIGAGIGVVLSAGVIFSGSLLVFLPPLWQRILFFPGFVVGGALYGGCGSLFPHARRWCEQYGILWAGVAAVGAAYGLAAIGIRALIGRFRRSPPE